ncbi:S-methyl-5'-thioadenosine phosphorylase [Nitrospina gracilis]|uniref:S-methyl-5'-thioadenosine phosphorylase n=1 Tax=Nitrospina gracilis TaxID=35801 RepID=UPI001F006021|nr:S-methyl-5'-thioadenosine phosphorylase [Nitrospina gracilis]MCF8720520.1 5'-methylthioadenosine phosphorylase [Nitrospina gracilis Nb-211]
MAADILGVIGGSGLYNMKDLKVEKEVAVDTPYGAPSDPVVIGELAGTKLAFLPRHGVGHRITPSEINYRANVFAMKKLGVERIVSVSAVGSMKEEIVPGHIVLPDQFIDRTHRRIGTFFTDGIVGHVSLADPICDDLHGKVLEAAQKAGAVVHEHGTYVCIEGPQFSTRAESNVYRSWGVEVIGMTNVTEAKLAREAGICYVTIALATDYDCWHIEEEPVTLEQVLEIMHNNVELAQTILKEVVALPILKRQCECGEAAKKAIVTDPAKIPDQRKRDLEPLFGKL